MKIYFALVIVLLCLPAMAQNSGIPNCPNILCLSYWFPSIRSSESQIPTPIQLWTTRYSSLILWECAATYSPYAIGPITKGKYRRTNPTEQTDYNKNVCNLQGAYRFFSFIFPEDEPIYSALFAAQGFNSNYTGTDLNNPQGIGNLIFNAVFEVAIKDRMNILGDIGVKYNRDNFTDYTKYTPVNRPLPRKLTYLDRWQPNYIEIKSKCDSNGQRFYFRDQRFVVPQVRYVSPVLTPPKILNSLPYNPPTQTFKKNPKAYIRKTQSVVNATAGLNDEKKILAEYFDQKLYSLGAIATFSYIKYIPTDFNKVAAYELLFNNVIFEMVSSSWKQKAIYDQVRPFSAVREVYNYLVPRKTIRSYGGPYQGTVDISPNEWESYLVVESHPEYPSGTACVCAVFAEATKLFFGTDVLNFTATFPKGSSIYEPGATPATNLNVTFDTYSTVSSMCGESRHWAGVHFQEAINESQRVCPQIAKIAVKHVYQLLKGDLSWKYW